METKYEMKIISAPNKKPKHPNQQETQINLKKKKKPKWKEARGGGGGNGGTQSDRDERFAQRKNEGNKNILRLWRVTWKPDPLVILQFWPGPGQDLVEV